MTTNIGDLRLAMRATKSAKGARAIISAARKRVADIQFVGWPALLESLKRELADCERIAREKGLVR